MDKISIKYLLNKTLLNSYLEVVAVILREQYPTPIIVTMHYYSVCTRSNFYCYRLQYASNSSLSLAYC